MEMLAATKGILRKHAPQTGSAGRGECEQRREPEAVPRDCPGSREWTHVSAPKAHNDLRDRGLQGGHPSSLCLLCPCWPQLAWEQV